MRPRPQIARVLIALTLVVAALMLALYAWLWRGLPSINALEAGLALPSTRLYDRHGRLLYEIAPTGAARQSSIALADVPAHCVHALIATEDADFYAHGGVSARGILRALWLNVRGGDVVAGGSTITQQVARNLLLDPHARAERTLRRKLREALLALQLERAYTKDELLALWLNQTDFGGFAYGIEAAARAYFGKGAPALALAECALLLGLPQSPVAYNPLVNLSAAQARQADVLRLMHEQGYIDATQRQIAEAEPLQFAAAAYPIRAPHAVLSAWEQLEAQYADALYTRGLEVTLSIDLALQEETERIVQVQLARLNDDESGNGIPANAHNAAVVILDPHTGEILTLLGSPNYFDEAHSGALNLALLPRQPGSTLKPFVYALAMSPPRAPLWNPATMLIDVQTPFLTRRLESYTPANFDFNEHGLVSMREALANSYNIPAVLGVEFVGVQPFIQWMNDLGVPELARNPEVDLSVVLGGGEVRLLNLTGAYGVLANGGERIPPQLLLSVNTADGTPLYRYTPPAPVRVMDARVAFLVTDMLADNAARTPVFGANSLLNIGRPAAAKTGTTTDFRDNWVLGYTPQRVVGVWVGNADYTPMRNVTGISGAGPIWHHTLRAALRNLPAEPFPVPAGVIQADVCMPSGKLPTPDCPLTRREWFLEEGVPTAPDDLYRAYDIDTRTGALATDSTPAAYRERRVFLLLPPEARAWGARAGIPVPPAALDAAPSDTCCRITSPPTASTYEINPSLPAHVQRLRLQVSAPSGAARVRYLLNGQPVAESTQPPFEAWWQLVTGTHTLSAEITLTDGSTLALAPVTFRVRAYTPPP